MTPVSMRELIFVHNPLPISRFHGRRLSDPELHAVDADGRAITGDDDPVVEALRTGEDVLRTLGLRAASGEIAWFSVRAGRAGSDRLPVRSTLRDVSDLAPAQEEARLLAGVSSGSWPTAPTTTR